MWGSAGMPSSVSSSAGGRNRIERKSPPVQSVRRQIAGKERHLGRAVEMPAVGPFARRGDADDRRQAAALAANQRFAGGADGGERDHIDLGAGVAGPRDGALRHLLEDRFEPVVGGMVQLVGLGRGEQDAVGARAKTAR